MSEEQIAKLNKEQDPLLRADYRTVRWRSDHTQSDEGEVVEVTEKLFTVADLSEVWVLANIPEKDITFIRADAGSEKSG